MRLRFRHTEDATFVCPRCGREQTIREFKEHGIEPHHAYKDCIGRHVPGVGCDWASYGLLGTLGKGRLVDGIEVFNFAGPPHGVIEVAVDEG